MNNYKWHNEIFERLLSYSEHMAHAYLFYGKVQASNNSFSLNFSRGLLCLDQNSINPCGVCDACLWMTTQSHPDFFSVDTGESDANEKLIPISSIRALKSFFEKSPHVVGGKKVALINQSDRMNNQATNALLKILEEPPSNSMIILSTNQPDLILPTVKSRCQLITLPEPTREQTADYLKVNNLSLDEGALAYFNSSPITSLDQHESYQKVKQITNILGQGKAMDSQLDNGDWLEFGLPWTVNVMQKWCYDLFSFKLTNELFYFPAKKEIIENLVTNLNLSKILQFLKKLNEVKVYASKPINKEINLELLVIEYRKVFN
tara:strand:+ start:61974 stop:62930 length:957 start_codon:yes stop_codon:yes gene_type:complete